MSRGRRRRRSRASGRLLLVISIVVTEFYLPNYFTRICFLFLLGSLWVAFGMPTTCDVQNKSAWGQCGNNCRGMLRACWIREHKRQKRAAILAWFGIRARAPIRWEGRLRGAEGSLSSPPVEAFTEPRVGRDAYDKAILILTALSVVGTFLPVLLRR